MRLTNPSFDMLVHKSWPSSSLDYFRSLSSFVLAAKSWKYNVFGNIFYKKKLIDRLNGIQNHASYPSNPYILKLELQLSSDPSSLLNQEKQFWALKSRINWLQHGDVNTKFCHTSTLKRRRNNRIISLRGQSGNWISGERPLTKYIFSHFSNLFVTSSTLSSYSESLSLHHLCLTTAEGLLLSKPPSLTEIIDSIKSLKPLTVPGPDGIHPFFYQKFIKNMLPSIHYLFNEIFKTCSST